MSFISGLFGGGDKSSNVTTNAPQTTNNQFDNRVVLGNGATQVGAGGSFASNSGNTSSTAFSVFDSSQRNTAYTDARSTTNIGTDPGVVQLGALNAGLLQAVGESQGDTVRAIARMGTDSIGSSAAAATNLFETSSTNASAAWGQTIDAASELIDRMMGSAAATITGAQTVARDAISSYQPTENKASDTQMRIALIGAAAVLLAAFLTRK